MTSLATDYVGCRVYPCTILIIVQLSRLCIEVFNFTVWVQIPQVYSRHLLHRLFIDPSRLVVPRHGVLRVTVIGVKMPRGHHDALCLQIDRVFLLVVVVGSWVRIFNFLAA